MDDRRHWQDWLNALIGLWLVASPWVINFLTAAHGKADWTTLNSILCGSVALSFAGAALIMYRRWEEWLQAATGLWLLVSPWIIQFSADRWQVLSAVVSGVVVATLAGLNLWGGRRRRS